MTPAEQLVGRILRERYHRVTPCNESYFISWPNPVGRGQPVSLRPVAESLGVSRTLVQRVVGLLQERP